MIDQNINLEPKKKKNGLVGVVIILLLLCLAMGGFIYLNKDKIFTKEEVTPVEKQEDDVVVEDEEENVFANEKIKAYYFETKESEDSKVFLTLVDAGNDSGYFSIRSVTAAETGGDGPLADGHFKISDGSLKLLIGPYAGDNKFEIEESVFSMLEASLTDDVDQENYKAYKTSYSDEITIGNSTFYRVNK